MTSQCPTLKHVLSIGKGGDGVNGKGGIRKRGVHHWEGSKEEGQDSKKY
jgi:hypothetical protein